MRLPVELLERIALEATSVNLAFVMQSVRVASQLIDHRVFWRDDYDIGSVSSSALLWLVALDDFDMGSLRWDRLAAVAEDWPPDDQRSLLLSGKADWAFEGILELGYLNDIWDVTEIMNERIESWLWHYAEPLEGDERTSRYQFAESARAAGAGTQWEDEAERQEQEERALMKVVNALFL